MFNFKNKVIPTPPRGCDDFKNSVDWSYLSNNFKKSPFPQWRGLASGFTLAEVLITLVIIGVIAAITVPSLITKTNNQETVSKLKKTYSTLAQATNQIILDEGPITSWVATKQQVFDLYKKKLLNAKVCDNSSGCLNQENIKYMNGGYSSNWDEEDWLYKLVLADGTQLMFAILYPNCNKTWYGTENYCAEIVVDLNGAKKPNTIGKDVFMFILTQNALVPAGCGSYQTDCNTTMTGYDCTCKVLKEEAINY